MILWNGHDVNLAPGFAAYLENVIGPLADTYTVESGYRSIAEQNAAYAKGRNAQGQVVDAAAIVTHARGGQSPHNYGMGIDLYPLVNGRPDYGGSREPSAAAFPAWSALWNAVDTSGELASGRFFTGLYDPGHVELKNWRFLIGRPHPADVTRTGGGVAPPAGTSDGTPPPDAAADDGTTALASDSFLVLDPGLIIGLAALAGAVLLIWWRK